MSVIAIGTDIVDIARIRALLKTFPQRFTNKCFTLAEREIAATRADPAPFYAARYAAKEAMVKCLGLGVRAGISWQDISITHAAHGKPTVSTSGAFAQHTVKIIPAEQNPVWHLSLSHEKDMALAFVILTSRSDSGM